MNAAANTIPIVGLESGPIKRFNPVPDIVKIDRKWEMPDFAPPCGMWEYEEKFRGKTGTIYIIECAGFIKIGMAKDFRKRLAGLELGCPLPITKIATRSVPLAALPYTETWLHQQFDNRRIKGEWFAVPPDEAVALLPDAVLRARVFEDECRKYHREQKIIQARWREAFNEWLGEDPSGLENSRLIEMARQFDRTPEAKALRS